MFEHERLHIAWCQAAADASAAELDIVRKDLAGLPVDDAERSGAARLRAAANELRVAALEAQRALGEAGGRACCRSDDSEPA